MCPNADGSERQDRNGDGINAYIPHNLDSDDGDDDVAGGHVLPPAGQPAGAPNTEMSAITLEPLEGGVFNYEHMEDYYHPPPTQTNIPSQDNNHLDVNHNTEVVINNTKQTHDQLDVSSIHKLPLDVAPSNPGASISLANQRIPPHTNNEISDSDQEASEVSHLLDEEETVPVKNGYDAEITKKECDSLVKSGAIHDSVVESGTPQDPIEKCHSIQEATAKNEIIEDHNEKSGSKQEAVVTNSSKQDYVMISGLNQDSTRKSSPTLSKNLGYEQKQGNTTIQVIYAFSYKHITCLLHFTSKYDLQFTVFLKFNQFICTILIFIISLYHALTKRMKPKIAEGCWFNHR